MKRRMPNPRQKKGTHFSRIAWAGHCFFHSHGDPKISKQKIFLRLYGREKKIIDQRDRCLG